MTFSFSYVSVVLMKIILLAKNAKPNKTLVKLIFDLSSKATHFGLPHTSQNIFSQKSLDFLNSIFNMELSVNKTIYIWHLFRSLDKNGHHAHTVELRWLKLIGTLGASSTHLCVGAIHSLTNFKLVHVYFMSSWTPCYFRPKLQSACDTCHWLIILCTLELKW